MKAPRAMCRFHRPATVFQWANTRVPLASQWAMAKSSSTSRNGEYYGCEPIGESSKGWIHGLLRGSGIPELYILGQGGLHKAMPLGSWMSSGPCQSDFPWPWVEGSSVPQPIFGSNGLPALLGRISDSALLGGQELLQALLVGGQGGQILTWSVA